MSDIPPSHDDKAVATNEPQDLIVKIAQPGQDGMATQEINLTRLFRESAERSFSMTKEEIEKELPWIKSNPPKSVDPVTAMAYLDKIMYGDDEEEVDNVQNVVGEGAGTADASKKTS